MNAVLSVIPWFVRAIAAYCAYMLFTGASYGDYVLMALEGLAIFIWADMEYKKWKAN